MVFEKFNIEYPVFIIRKSQSLRNCTRKSCVLRFPGKLVLRDVSLPRRQIGVVELIIFALKRAFR